MSENIKQEESTVTKPILQNVNFESLWKGFLKFWWVCVILALLFAAYSVYRTRAGYSPMYESSVTFTVQTKGTSSNNGNGISYYTFSYNRSIANQLAETFPTILQSRILQDNVCNELNIEYFPCTLSSSSVSGSNLFTITARGRDPQMTYTILNSVIRNYPSVSEYVIGNTQLQILAEPTVATEPINKINYTRQAIRQAIVGFLLGFAWIFFYSISRDTVCSSDDIRKKLNQQTLGALPEVVFKKHKQKINRSVAITNNLVGMGYMESFRAFRNSVLNKLGDRKVILVTGTAPGEGKTSVSANLAISLAQLHKKVILIDGDLRNPSVSKFFDIPDENTESAISVSVGDSDTLSIIRFLGQQDSVWDLLKPETMNQLFQHLKDTADYIVIDTSPIGITSEPTAFAQYADAAIMVVKQDTIRTLSVINAIEALLSTDINLLGCVLNGSSSTYNWYGSKYKNSYGSYGSYNYGYRGSYGYGYGYGSRERAREKGNDTDK